MATSGAARARIELDQLGRVLGRLSEALSLPPGGADQIRQLASEILERDSSSEVSLSFALCAGAPEIQLSWQARSFERELQRLRERFSAPCERLQEVAPILLRGEGEAALRFAARIWPPARPVAFNVSFDAQALGRLNAPALAEQVLTQLGFTRAWQAVSGAMPRGPEFDEVRRLTVELSESARVTVSIGHVEATADVVRAAAGGVAAARFVQAARALGVACDESSSLETSLSFTEGASDPVAASVMVVISPPFEAPLRAAFGEGAAATVASFANALAQPDSAADAPMLAQVSLASPDERIAFTFGERAASERFQRPRGPVEQLVHGYEAHPFSLHPFLERMSRSTIDVRHMWLMFHNVYLGLSQHFPRRLARVVLGIEDERIRSILTEQLHEELGSGDYTRTHRILFLKLLEALSPWKPDAVTPEMSVPGANLSERLEATYFDPHPYTGVGAAIVIELLGKQVDQFLAAQFRRQQAVGMASLEWLTLHETLEVDHAGESLELAGFIEREEDRAAAWRGGQAIYTTGWLFFDDMYRLCFGQ